MRKITVHNPNNLPTIDYRKLHILQGDLKVLSEENLRKLCDSILKHGYFVPAFVWRSDDLWILDATQRYHALEALEKQGYVVPEIPYIEIEAKDKKDAAEKLLQITSRYGTINEDTSFFEDFDIDLSFINEIEIPELNIKLDKLEPDIEEDEVLEPPAEPISKTGEIWCCGRHRIMCGDATKAEDVERLMDGKKADMVFTDPPYGVDYGATNSPRYRKRSIEGDRPIKSEMHPTQKPVELPARAIKNSSRENDIIADFFIGSGSTLIACEQLNRVCYGMEIAPMYIDVILDRYAKFTGDNPVREDGVKWSELHKTSQ